MKEEKGREKRIAEVLSKYVNNLNNGDTAPISEFLAGNEDITDELQDKLHFVQFLHRKVGIWHAPRQFKEELLEKLKKEMGRIVQKEEIDKPIELILQEKSHFVLRYLRQKVKKSIDDVARELNINRDTLLELEKRNDVFISAKTWSEMAKLYKVNIRWLGIVLRKVNWHQKPSKRMLAAQYHGEYLSGDEKELINRFFTNRNNNVKKRKK